MYLYHLVMLLRRNTVLFFTFQCQVSEIVLQVSETQNIHSCRYILREISVVLYFLIVLKYKVPLSPFILNKLFVKDFFILQIQNLD